MTLLKPTACSVVKINIFFLNRLAIDKIDISLEVHDNKAKW